MHSHEPCSSCGLCEDLTCRNCVLSWLYTGVLSSRPTSRDIKIDGFSMGLNGIELIQDCSIELTIGRRYGLIGQNGCGKTNFLQCLANREVSRRRTACLLHVQRARSRVQSTCMYEVEVLSHACTFGLMICSCVASKGRGGAGWDRPGALLTHVVVGVQVPIPDHMDLYHLSEEVEPTPRTALETVVDYIKNEIDRLNKLEEHILETIGPEDERLQVGLQPARL